MISIGELARRTGLSVAQLRAWEARHGFPTSERPPGGHRRYRPDEVERVVEVARLHGSGLNLAAAIREVTTSTDPVARLTREMGGLRQGSVFATLRSAHPHLPVQTLRKATLTALSWAIEDEFCAKAEHAHLFGAFQHAKHFEPSRLRWVELSRVAASAFVLADFLEDPDTPQHRADEHATLVQVPLTENSPLRREWAVVCDSVELPVVLTAWELPGQGEVSDSARLFEAIWSIDPAAVRDAARVCASYAAQVTPAAAAPTLFHLADDPLPTTPNLVALNTMFARVLRYVDQHLVLA